MGASMSTCVVQGGLRPPPDDHPSLNTNEMKSKEKIERGEENNEAWQQLVNRRCVSAAIHARPKARI
jgi:hypothetical protein